MVVDCTVEGLTPARELPEILNSGARVLYVSNEHREALERLAATAELKEQGLAAARLAKGAKLMYELRRRARLKSCLIMSGR